MFTVPAPVAAKGYQDLWVATSGIADAPGTSCGNPGYVGVTEVAIQEAVDAASSGDVIHICGGHYDIGTTINLGVKDLTLKSSGSAVLDGGATVAADGTWISGGHQILTSSADLTVVGFTMTHARTNWLGGAIYTQGKLTLLGGLYTFNNADGYGGAVYAVQDVVATSSKFLNNHAPYGGGGIYGSAAVTLRRAYFANNVVSGCSLDFDSDCGGGAVYAYTTIADDHSVYVMNHTRGEGGAIYAGEQDTDGKSVIKGSRFLRNTADYGGGAIATDNSNLTIIRSRFVRNRTLGWGGVMLLNTDSGPGNNCYEPNCDLTVRGSLFRGNRAPRHQGNILVMANGVGSKVRFIANIMQVGPRDAIISSAAHVRGMPFKIQEMPN